MEPTLKAPESERLKLRCDEPPLSEFAFKFNLCHYSLVLSRQHGEIVVSRVVLTAVTECPVPGSAAAAPPGSTDISAARGGAVLEVDMERVVRMVGRCRLTV
jgi:hypothetical protein